MSPPRPRWRQVLALTGIPAVLAGALLGRLAYGMLPVAALLALLDTSGSLRTAAVLAAVHGFAGAVAFPLKGRVVDRHGPPALLLMAAATVALLVLLLPVGGTGPLFIVLLLAALASPPVTSTVRSALAARVPAELTDLAFSLDAGLEEMAFLAGPALAGLAITAIGPRQVLLLSGGLLGAAALLLARSAVPTERQAAPAGGLSPLTRRIAVLFAAGALAQGLVAVTIAAAARALHSASLYGLLLSLDGVGALLGLWLFARVRRGPSAKLVLLSVLVPALTLPLLAAHGRAPLVAAVTVLGLPVAALAATLNAAVAAMEAPGRRGHAFAVLITCQNLAGALGFALGGVLAEQVTPTAPALLGFLVSAAAAVLVAPRIGRALGASS